MVAGRVSNSRVVVKFKAFVRLGQFAEFKHAVYRFIGIVNDIFVLYVENRYVHILLPMRH